MPPGQRRKAGYWSRLRKDLTLQNVLFNPSSVHIMFFLMIFEIALNIFIIKRVKYTEIDWSTYMEQVECFLNGTRNYSAISGSTGPVVYPAGHLYFYSLLYFLTEQGKDIRKAQYFFAVVYLLTLMMVFWIYKRHAKLPPYAFVFMCCTSYRIHSIYVLRLFNDTIAMLLVYIAIIFFIYRKWTFGSIFYSLAVSVKMNVLLFAPALLLIFLHSSKPLDVIKNLTICGFVQLILGLPFLLDNPLAYITSSFDIGRMFLHKWTVNWRFLPIHVFVSRYFHATLLLCHLTALLLFFKRWFRTDKWFPVGKELVTHSLSDAQILLTLFTANFIGISFARSLHYQFYVWYFHSLPLLLWSTPFQPKTKLCILGLIELSWNTYPSTDWSSGLLHFLHFLILFGLWKNSNNLINFRLKNK